MAHWGLSRRKKSFTVRNFSIKLYRIYVCYTNITLYDVIYSVRPWNVLPVDMAVHLYLGTNSTFLIIVTSFKKVL
jgi:hypothetical protein